MNNYIYEYNNNRPQWNRKKMTPVNYRNHLLDNYISFLFPLYFSGVSPYISIILVLCNTNFNTS